MKTYDVLFNQPLPTLFSDVKPVRTIGGMEVFYLKDAQTVRIPGPHIPVVGCYDVPSHVGFRWAVALGEPVKDAGPVRSVPISRYIYTKITDPQHHWVYRADWETRSPDTQQRCLRILRPVMESLEAEVSRVLVQGGLAYEAAGRSPVEVWPYRQVRGGDPTVTIDLVVQAHIVAFRWS